MILAVGRFFVGGHSKRQDLLIDAFKQLLEQSRRPLELHLAGSLVPEREHVEYLASLQARAKGLPIKFHVNVDHQALQDLYRRAKVYWHATGLQQDLSNHPEMAEHFGISLVEAMSAGAVPLAFDAGGPREIIRNGKDGFLYTTVDQLVLETGHLLAPSSSKEWKKLSISTRQRASKYSTESFKLAVELLLKEYA